MRRPANALEFRNLESTPPSDFSTSESGLYFTKQEQVAWKSAQWAAKYIDGRVISVGILQVGRNIFRENILLVGRVFEVSALDPNMLYGLDRFAAEGSEVFVEY